MKNILEKLFLGTQHQTFEEITRIYEQKKTCVVNFLYYATAVQNHIFESTQKSEEQKKFKEALLNGNFLLPDGIALKLFFEGARKRGIIQKIGKYYNLNGTDFVPYFLKHFKNRCDHNKVTLDIVLYGAKKNVINKAKEVLAQQNYNIIFIQDGYNELNFGEIKRSKNSQRIILIGRGSPRQELRSQDNKKQIENNQVLIFSVGGLFDFLAGTETRAPIFIRRLKLERLRRILTDPKKNLHKTLNSLLIFPHLLTKIVLKK